MGIPFRNVVTFSLKTRDPHEAKRLQAALSAQWEERWDQWREALASPPHKLSQKDIFALTRDALLEALERLEANPGKPRTLEAVLAHYKRVAAKPSAIFRKQLEHSWRGYLATRHGWHNVELSSVERLIDQSLTDMPKAIEKRLAMAREGDYSKPEWLINRPPMETSKRGAFNFDALFQLWEKRGKGLEQREVATVRKYRSQLDRFRAFLGHDDPTHVTHDDAARYLEHICKPDGGGSLPAAKQVHDMMVNLSTLFNAAVKAKKLPDNPISGNVPPKEVRGQKKRRRIGYTLEQGSAVLRASRTQSDPWLRWGPWVLAYTGMRVEEAAQLRKVDIETVADGDAFIRISPEAGHTKNDKERLVPVHRALAQEGFLGFVGSVKGERLFPKVCLSANGTRRTDGGRWADRGSERLSEWLKPLGIVPRDVSPNHGFRHSFEVLAVGAEMSSFVIDRIMGHTDKHVRAAYQRSQFMALLAKEVRKFPSYI